MNNMIIAYAGRRNLAAPERTSGMLGELVLQLNPRLVIGSAAAGADLLMLEQARSHGIPAHVVLLDGVAEFERESVADIGPHWSWHYHAVLRDPQTTVETVVGPRGGGPTAHLEINKAIAAAVTASMTQGEQIVVIVVRAQPKPSGDITEHLAELAAERGWQVIAVPDDGSDAAAGT